MRWTTPIVNALVLLALPAPTTTAWAANGEHRYVTAQDVVVCDTGNGIGGGGVCIPFGDGDALHVVDALRGETVVVAICVDNDGNGLCTTQPIDDPCDDVVVGNYAPNWPTGEISLYNPVGPLPTSFAPGCPGGRFPGYVVAVCSQVRVTRVESTPTTGTATLTTGGEGTSPGRCGDADRFAYGVDAASVATGVSGHREAPDGSFTGELCSFTATNDPTGLINQRGPEQVVAGVVASVWSVPGATRVTIECTIQYGPKPRANWSQRAAINTTPGSTGHVAEVFPNGRLQLVLYYQFVCTYVSWTLPDGSVRYFAVDPATGHPVALATGPGGECR